MQSCGPVEVSHGKIRVRPNGGLEFYSEDCKKRLASRIEEDIVLLRNRLESMNVELESVKKEAEYNNAHLDEWTVSLQRNAEDLEKVQSRLDCLVIQAKNGELGEDEKSRLRYQLKTEVSALTKQKDELQKKVDRCQECKTRERFLPLYISEIEHKIAEKERSMAATSTFTVEHPGILTIPFIRGLKGKACCIFADILDYLAYVRLAHDNREEGFPRYCDSLVLNDSRNFLKLLLASDVYDDIYCFFPDTVTGKTLEFTVLQRNDSRAVSMSHLFDGYVTLFEYCNSIDGCSPLKLLRL